MNLFANLPSSAQEEIQILLQSGPVRIERIVSNGEASPQGFWYDQDQEEWVVLLRGTATLEFQGNPDRLLGAGDYLLIPAHTKHRVSAVSEDAIWLGFHFQGAMGEPESAGPV